MDNANRQIRINMEVLQSILIKHTLGLTFNIVSSPPLNGVFCQNVLASNPPQFCTIWYIACLWLLKLMYKTRSFQSLYILKVPSPTAVKLIYNIMCGKLFTKFYDHQRTLKIFCLMVVIYTYNYHKVRNL